MTERGGGCPQLQTMPCIIECSRILAGLGIDDVPHVRKGVAGHEQVHAAPRQLEPWFHSALLHQGDAAEQLCMALPLRQSVQLGQGHELPGVAGEGFHVAR